MRSLCSSVPIGTTAWLIAVTCLFVGAAPLQAQFSPQQVIATEVDLVVSVYAVDPDSDQDILSASLGDDKIAWYENTDGLGGFGPQQVITTEVQAPFSVYAADFDGDGDTDVLSGSSSAVSWFENMDRAVNVTPVLSDLPQGYRLFSAFPNPFGAAGSQTGGPYPETMIRYALPQRAFMRRVVYNVQGQLVRVLVEAEQSAGRYAVPFEVGALPSGVYLYRLEAGIFQETRPMILLK